MKQRTWYLSIIVFVLSALLLDACSFSVEVMTPGPTVPATFTSVPASASPTPVPFTLIAPFTTPTLILIRSDTIYMLEVFKSFALNDIVRSVAFTPDGTVLAAAGGNTEDFAIHLWDVASGQSLGTLNGHTGIVWGVAFSLDGKLLASVSSDKTAKVWDWRTGTVIKSLDFPGEVVSVSFSPDGQNLAVGGVDEPQNQVQNAAIWTYSVDSWAAQVKFPEFLDIAALAYSPKGGTLIGGGTSRNVQVWRASDGAPVFTLSHAHQVSKAAISPDGSTVATATCQTVANSECTEGGVWLWDLPSGKLIKKLAGFPDIVENVAFSADGSILIAASRSGILRFYTTSDYQSKFETTSPGGISALTLSPDGGLLATGSNNGAVNLWRVVYRP